MRSCPLLSRQSLLIEFRTGDCKVTKRKMGVIAAFIAAATMLPGAASAACNGCTIEMHDGSLPARAYGEAIGGAVGGMVGGAVGSTVGGVVGTAAGGVAGGIGGGIVGGAAGTAAGDHAGTFYGGAAGGLIDHMNGGK